MGIRKKVASATTNLHQDRDKGTNKIPQIKRLAQCFSEKPKTMYQAERETGVRIANICRFIDKMKKSGTIRKVSSGKCPISHRQAGFYTSNREYLKDDMPSLFEILWKGVRR